MSKMSKEEIAKLLMANGIHSNLPSYTSTQMVRPASAGEADGELNANMTDQVVREFLNTLIFNFEKNEGPLKKPGKTQKKFWAQIQTDIQLGLARIPKFHRESYVANESEKAFLAAFHNIQRLHCLNKEDAIVAVFTRLIFQSCASMLLEAAQNDPTFLPIYGLAITEVVADAQSIVNSPREGARSHLARMESWPLNITLNNKLDASARKLLFDYELGESSVIKLRNSGRAGRQVSLDGESNAYTVKLIRYIHSVWANRKFIKKFQHCGLIDVSKAHQKVISLPRLTQEAAHKWFAAAWAIVLEQNGNAPEVNPNLVGLGEYRRQHVHVTGHQFQAKGFSKSASEISARKTEMSNLRDGIHTKIQEAFYRLTRLQNTQRKSRPRKG